MQIYNWAPLAFSRHGSGEPRQQTSKCKFLKASLQEKQEKLLPELFCMAQLSPGAPNSSARAGPRISHLGLSSQFPGTTEAAGLEPHFENHQIANTIKTTLQEIAFSP